jgi:hypothetical protein
LKTDPELLRRILFALRDKTDILAQPVLIPGYEYEAVCCHTMFLRRLRCLDALFEIGKTGQYTNVEALRLTDKGRDLLRMADDEPAWERFKEHLPQNIQEGPSY